jgi:hypothetical protein
MNEQIAKIIDASLFGTTDGDLIPDEDASIPVGEYRRLIREEAIPALVHGGLLRSASEVKQFELLNLYAQQLDQRRQYLWNELENRQARIDKALRLSNHYDDDNLTEARALIQTMRDALSGPASPPAAEPLSPASKATQSGGPSQSRFHFGDWVAWADSDGDWHGGTLVGFFRAEGDEWWAVEDELGFVHDVHERDFLTRLRPAPTAGEA